MGHYQRLDKIELHQIATAGLSAEDAVRFHKELNRIIREYGPGTPQAWAHISKHLLRPDLPFPLHQMMYYGCYHNTPLHPPPAWIPDLEASKSTNIGRVLEKHGKQFLGSNYINPVASFSDFHKFSVANPEAYWKIVLNELRITFSSPPSCILRMPTSDEDGHVSSPGGQWLEDAVLNVAGNCLNPTDKKKLEDVMIMWRNEAEDNLPVNRMTLDELRSQVYPVANALETLGLVRGSAIGIAMPMSVTAVIIYLAIVLAGYVVVSIADSFASHEISSRLKISNSKAVFTQDFIIRGGKHLPLYSKIIDAHAPLAVVLSGSSTFSTTLRDEDTSWADFLERVKNSKSHHFQAVEQPVLAFTNILFSSGTTGEPKAVPWTHSTPLKAASDGWAHMDIHSGDVVAWPTNLGWMMGPWLVYASLLNGASIALYNGSPLSIGFAKFVQDAKVTMLGVVPSIVRSWRASNCTAGLDWSSIRCFSSTGEASSADEYLWLMARAHYKPVIEYCGGTEIGGGFVSGSLLQPQSLAAFSTPAMGCSLFILGKDGVPLPQGTPGIGELALDPIMFGASSVLINADHHNVYFKGMPMLNGKVLRRHGDEFELTTGGYYRAHGRADDTMNLGGIKVSSIEIERICDGVHSTVLETAAFGVPPLGGGPEQLVLAVVFKDPNNAVVNVDDLKMAFNSALQKKLNPLFKVSRVVKVPLLPRTASNKVMRRVLRQEFNKDEDIAKL